jgi:hypothetical protein
MVGKLTPDAVLSCSRLPAIMGLSPYSTPNDELAKSIDALNGKFATWQSNEAADFGNLIEPIILQEMVQRLQLDTFIAPTTPYAAPDGIALNASLDGVGAPGPQTKIHVETNIDRGIYLIGCDELTITGPGVLESKLTSALPEDEPADHRGPIQLQGCMLCSGYEWGAIGVLYRGVELRIFVYPRNETMIVEIIDLCADFERRKWSQDWYSPVSATDAANTWRYGDDTAPPVELIPETIDLMEDILTAKELIKAAEATIDECSAALMEILGNHVEGMAIDPYGTTYRVRWPMRNYKAQPIKVTPAKEAYQKRAQTLDITIIDKAA